MSSVPIYVGRWTDYSRGRVLGDTVTLDVRWSGYLIAALSTFIGIVGAAFWVITAFVIHQFSVREKDDDGVFFQHQVIYRNQGSAAGVLLDLFFVCWNWRKQNGTGRRVNNLTRRTVFRSVPPLFVFIGFTAAAVFVGEVGAPTYLGNNVKVQPSNCGFWAFDTDSDPETGLSEEYRKSVNDTLAARQYSRSCYHSNSISTNCAFYPVKSVPYHTSMIPCPFANDPTGHELCLPAGNEALELDTGYLDTDEIFGINAASNDRILFRKVATCSPIRAQAYLNKSNTDISGFAYWEFDMGPNKDLGPYTYKYDTQTIKDIVGYQVSSFPSYDGDRVWMPVDAFNVPNADISIHFLASNTVAYVKKVDDLWFSATNPQEILAGDGINVIRYLPDRAVSVMTCIDQYQICNANSSASACTILGSAYDMNLSYPLLGLNSNQKATVQRFTNVLQWIQTFIPPFVLGSQALLANDLVIQQVLSSGVPSNQWQLEVRGWFETSLATLQDYIVQFAVNTGDLGQYGYIMKPDPEGTAEEQGLAHFCSNQRVRNTGGYRSFSFLGIMIVVCVGSAIILLSWILEPLVAYLRHSRGSSSSKCRGTRDYREVARMADRKLQLHRMALVGAGYDRIWEQTMDEIPIATAGAMMPPPSRRLAPNDGDYHYGASRMVTAPVARNGSPEKETSDSSPGQTPAQSEKATVGTSEVEIVRALPS